MARGTKKIKNVDIEENLIIKKLEKEIAKKQRESGKEEDRKTLEMLNLIRVESKRYRKKNDNTFILVDNPREQLTRHEITFELLKKCYNKSCGDKELKTFFILVEVLISLIQEFNAE